MFPFSPPSQLERFYQANPPGGAEIERSKDLLRCEKSIRLYKEKSQMFRVGYCDEARHARFSQKQPRCHPDL